MTRAPSVFNGWVDLNEKLRVASEKEVAAMLAGAKRERRALAYLLRIHSRLNKLRADREREELKAIHA